MSARRPDDISSGILAQSRPAGTSATAAYTVGSNEIVELSKIILANTTGSSAAGSVYIDDDGTTYDETTAILFGKSISANDSQSIEFEDGIALYSGANIAVKQGTGSAITFTIIGRRRDTL